MAKSGNLNQPVLDALVAGGFITNPNNVYRIVIDIRGDQGPMVHVQHFAHGKDIAEVVDAIAQEMPTFDPARGRIPVGPYPVIGTEPTEQP